MLISVMTVKGDVAQRGGRKGVLYPKGEDERNRIRLNRSKIVLRYAQAKIDVTTGATDLVVIEPLLDVRAYLLAGNGVVEVLSNQPLWIFVSKLDK